MVMQTPTSLTLTEATTPRTSNWQPQTSFLSRPALGFAQQVRSKSSHVAATPLSGGICPAETEERGMRPPRVAPIQREAVAVGGALIFDGIFDGIFPPLIIGLREPESFS